MKGPKEMTSWTNRILLVVVLLALSDPAFGVNPIALDRNYQFGDDSAEGASQNGPVGANFTNNAGQPFTADSAGADTTDFTDFQDLRVFGNPLYRDVSSRPGITSGLGIEFDGNGDYLRGANLNLPETSQAAIGYDDDPGTTPINEPGTLNYNGINNRFLQFWVNPDAASQNQAQTLVMDSNQHGVRIENGRWSMRYSGIDYDSGVSVPFGQWSHVMLARPAGSTGADGGSRLYVNGVAVSAASGGYDGGATEELVIGSNTSRDSDNEFDGGTGEYFDGLMDNLNMWVVGDNSSDVGPPPGMDFGEFDFLSDNEFAADIYSFDLLDFNQDGTPANSGDVDAFVSGWRSTQSVNGVRIGDLNSLANGDANLDGTVDLLDWAIVNAASPAAGSAIASALSGVPEPNTLVLFVLGAMLTFGRRRC